MKNYRMMRLHNVKLNESLMYGIVYKTLEMKEPEIVDTIRKINGPVYNEPIFTNDEIGDTKRMKWVEWNQKRIKTPKRPRKGTPIWVSEIHKVGRLRRQQIFDLAVALHSKGLKDDQSGTKGSKEVS